MDPVSPMADLLSAVTTVITSFTSWLTSLTTALIGNPIIQLLFAMIVVFSIVRLVIGLVKSAGKHGRGGKKRR